MKTLWTLKRCPMKTLWSVVKVLTVLVVLGTIAWLFGESDDTVGETFADLDDDDPGVDVDNA